jgi:hypothetical protein
VNTWIRRSIHIFQHISRLEQTIDEDFRPAQAIQNTCALSGSLHGSFETFLELRELMKVRQ